MTTSCLGGISNYDSNRANPQFVAGMEKIREVKGAIDIVSRTTQACKSLAGRLQGDYYKRYPPLPGTGPIFAGVAYMSGGKLSGDEDLSDCVKDLSKIQKLCNHTKKEINHLERNFVRQYSRIPAGETATGNSNINWEMRQLSSLGSNFSQKAAPLARSAEYFVDTTIRHCNPKNRQAVNLTGAISHVDYISSSIR